MLQDTHSIRTAIRQQPALKKMMVIASFSGILEQAGDSRLLKDTQSTLRRLPSVVTVEFLSVDRMTDGTAAIWDVQSGNRLRALHTKEHLEDRDRRRIDNSVHLAEISSDGRRVLTGNQLIGVVGFCVRNLTMWDTESGERLRTFESINRARAPFRGVQLVPGSNESSSSYDERGNLLLIDINEQITRTFETPSSADFLPVSLSCSPRGSFVLANLLNGKLAVWDTSTGSLLRTLSGHSSSYACGDGDFDPSEQFVCTGASDGMVRMWDLMTGEELARLINVGDQSDWLVTTPEGLFDGSPVGRETVTFRVGSGLNVVPVDRFFQDFYYPGLLAAIWRGERPMPTTQFSSKLAPTIKIVSPAQGGTVDSAQLELQVDVTDRGGGVKGPWLLQNRARVLSAGNSVAKGKTVERTFEVALVEGENRIEICAASEDGSWESEPAVITFTYDKPVAKPQLHLVAVGVNQYAEETMRLKFAADDATAVAQLFTTRGPALYGAGRVHVTHVLDNQATSDGIRRAIEGVAKQAKPQDTFLLFLAGHGITIGQRYYFIPHDFKHQSDSLDEDIRQQGLAGDVVGDWVGSVPALKRIVIFDTCQSGATIRLPIGTRNPFAFRGALERLSRAQGLFTIAAASASEEAQEVDELGHGVLTYALLAGLAAVDEGPLKNQHVKTEEANTINVREWFGYAQDKVPLLTKLHFGQEQFVGFSGQGQSFPVLPLE